MGCPKTKNCTYTSRFKYRTVSIPEVRTVCQLMLSQVGFKHVTWRWPPVFMTFLPVFSRPVKLLLAAGNRKELTIINLLFSVRKYVNYELEFLWHRLMFTKWTRSQTVSSNSSGVYSEGIVSHLCRGKRYIFVSFFSLFQNMSRKKLRILVSSRFSELVSKFYYWPC